MAVIYVQNPFTGRISYMNPIEQFKSEVKKNVRGISEDLIANKRTRDWIQSILPHQYTHNFSWMGRPLIQFPQDIMAVQEIIWEVRPDLIIETGIAHGGSLVMSASFLSMLDYQDALEKGELLDPGKPKRKVLGVDIDIREHNRREIESHPMSPRIDMIQGSSIDRDIIARVHDVASKFDRVMVMLDSNHTHDHVLAELVAYASLTTKGSYCLVFDTAIEDVPSHFFNDRPWGVGNNPKTAVWEYLDLCAAEQIRDLDGNTLKFEIDKAIEYKILITAAPDGYLQRL